jgi:hypothetical protein
MSYNRIEITKKSHPAEWRLILLAFPNYRKRTANVVETENTTLHGRYWDGGSISRYAIIGLAKTVNQIPNRNDFPFTAPDIEVDLMDGRQVVQCGVFCGKPGQAYLYRKPSEG